jgi:pimeloyl-ACP methyl ester carboxylesterase
MHLSWPLKPGLKRSQEYWNGYNDAAAATFPGEYSWVAHAQSQGYSTLAIDNLGNGRSDHPDPVSIVQGSLQSSILQKVIQQLRAGSLQPIPKYQKVIFASHSYGSILARLIAQFYPINGADAYVLNTTSNNLTGLNSFIAATHAQSASAVKPDDFAAFAPGY